MLGFETSRKLIIKRISEENICEIIKLYKGLYNLNNPVEKKRIQLLWQDFIQKEKHCNREYTMLIRDKCNSSIGLVSVEQKQDGIKIVDIWIPSKVKRCDYLDHIAESMLEWLEDYSPDNIKRIIIRELKDYLKKEYIILEDKPVG